MNGQARKLRCSIRFALIVPIIAVLFSCGPRHQSDNGIGEISSDSETSYAQGFGFKRYTDFFHVWINSDGDNSANFYLIDKSIPIPQTLQGKKNIIRTPVTSVVCTSTTQIPWLDQLGASSTLIGFPDPEYLYSPVQQQRFLNGLLTDMGGPSGMEVEQLVNLKPDLVLSFSGRREEHLESVLEKLTVPLLKTREHLEAHPLGRAEWIRFMGLLLNKTEKADSIFNAVRISYLQLVNASQAVAPRPTVLTGIPYSGTWYLPGRSSFAVQLFEDAGFECPWKDQGDKTVLPMAFESAFQLGLRADHWIGISNLPSVQSLLSSDSRFSKFKSVQNSNLWTYDRRSSPSGGNDYFETAGVRPDLLLRDLITIRTSGDTSSLYFYRRLR